LEAEKIRIVVMRLSALSQTALDTTSSSASSEARRVEGHSTIPELFHGYSEPDLAIQKSSSPKTVATLPLPKGRYWLRASFTVAGVNGHGQDPPVNIGFCRLYGIGSGQLLTADSIDYEPLDVLDKDWEGNRRVYVLEAAANVGDAGFARLQCWQTGGMGDLVVRGVRITALRAGTLKNVTATTGAVATSVGSGTPVVFHTHRGPVTIHGPSSVDVAKISLPAGRWLLAAKIQPADDATTCSLVTAGSTADEVSDPIIVSVLSMQTVKSFTDPWLAVLRCTNATDATVDYARMTAVKVSGP